MFPAVARIFVSSTWIDLQPEREAVKDAIHRMSEAKFIGMEYFGSRPDSTEEASLDEVDRADIYLGIIGGRYGSGITEAEYRRARERDLPCFIYFKDDAAIPPNFRDPEPGKTVRLAALKEELYSRHIISTPFATPHELASRVRDDLHRWFFDTHLSAALAGQVAGNIVASRESGDPLRVESGFAYGSVLHRSSRPRIVARETPLRPNVRPFRELLDRQPESKTAMETLGRRLPVQLYGEDGIGKTALLRHLSHQDLTGELPDGVVFHHQVGRQPAGDLLQFLFDSFYQSEPNYRPSEAERLEMFREKRALIVMDDVESGRAEVEDLLNAFPESAFLIAGRERVLYGEGRTLLLPGLPADESRRLLERELGRPIAPNEVEPVRTICEALKGHPLAIAQAAAYAFDNQISLNQLAERVGQRYATSLPDETADRLPEDEKRILAILSALAGAPIQAENLELITGLSDAERAAESLARRNLAELTAHGWRTSGLIRDRRGDDKNLRERIIGHFADWIERNAGDRIKIENSAPALLACIDWAEAADQPRAAIRLGRGLEPILESSGRWDAALDVLESIDRHAVSIEDAETLAWVKHQQGTLALGRGDDEAARRLLTDSLNRRIEMGDHIAASVTRHNLDFLLPPVIPPSKPATTTPGRFPGWIKFPLIAALVGGALFGGKAIIDRFTTEDRQVLAFRPEAIEFGRRAPGSQSEPRVIQIGNPGEGEIEMVDFRIGGSDPNRFPIIENQCFGARIRRGDSCRVLIAYLPDAPGSHTAELQIRGAGGIDLGSLPLSGEAAVEEEPVEPTPETSPTGQPTPDESGLPEERPTPEVRPTTPEIPAEPAPINPVLLLSPGEIDFGEIQVGERSDRSIRIGNDGDGPLEIARIDLTGTDSGRFAIIANSCSGATIPPGRSCALRIGFGPRAEERSAAGLVIRNNSSRREETVRLRGAGFSPAPERRPTPRPTQPEPQPERQPEPQPERQPEPRPGLDVRPGQLDFGEIQVGSASNPLRLAVRNTGNVEIAFDRIRLSGSDDKDFRLRSNCSRTLPLSRGCALSVVFTPQKEGRRTARIEIESNAEQVRVELTGAGLAVRRQPAGWCCLNGRVTQMERNACLERKGSFFEDQRTAVARCRPIETRQPDREEPKDRQPPATPKPRGPGSGLERRPANVSNCQKMILSWAEVSDPSSPVTYTVTVQTRPLDATSSGWREILSTKTERTSQQAFSGSSRISSKLLYRWAVSATDAAGNSSRPSPPFYFTCGSDTR